MGRSWCRELLMELDPRPWFNSASARTSEQRSQAQESAFTDICLDMGKPEAGAMEGSGGLDRVRCVIYQGEVATCPSPDESDLVDLYPSPHICCQLDTIPKSTRIPTTLTTLQAGHPWKSRRTPISPLHTLPSRPRLRWFLSGPLYRPCRRDPKSIKGRWHHHTTALSRATAQQSRRPPWAKARWTMLPRSG